MRLFLVCLSILIRTHTLFDMPTPFTEVLSHFENFLLAYIHSILYLRTIYPKTTFVQARFHNTAVHQSRHPDVCSYIQSVASSIHAELLSGVVARIGVVLYCLEWEPNGEGSAQVVERYVLDVNAFPAVVSTNRDRETEMEERDPLSPVSSFTSDTQKSVVLKPPEPCKASSVPLDEHTPPDLSEQFRATFIKLTTHCSKLKCLPKSTAWQIYMEPKGGNDVDVQRPKQWGPVQHPAEVAETEDTRMEIYPVRGIVYEALVFEAWIEVYNVEKENAPHVSHPKCEGIM
jgi:mitotic spindle assembly checkpoint protein MAD2B